MTVMNDLKKAANIAKRTVLENLDAVTVRTGDENPFGDKTLLLDQLAEDNAVAVLRASDTVYAILTEEKGMIKPSTSPEYLVVLDPIDGSTNLERGIPLCSVGISAIPFTEQMSTDDIEISIIDSLFTDEKYVAIKGGGATKNGKTIKPILEREEPHLIISYDLKKELDGDFGRRSLQTLCAVYDMRRTGSNLLDLCWTASGGLDAMIDFRDILPIVHVSGIHMVQESGGYVLDSRGERFSQPFEMNKRMNFIAARNETLARTLYDAFNQ